ncbi:MAG: protein-L-isoaspartate(D-aspartate) O-methyltransferase [Planctomycetota bacterium]|nr:protein-L-isoaspartate(D-aspartate) O-methyltransferase [Planctomycetota bacterium]
MSRTASFLEDPAARRAEMVRRQIKRRGVSDPLALAAMRTVPRHEFVPETERPFAYDDRPLQIGHRQTISQPYIVALMTELCGLRGGESVLEIGTGSGYQAAVLAEIAGSVHSVEIIEPLLRRAAGTLLRLHYGNVVTRLGDGGAGWPEVGPFDAIVLTAAAPRVPKLLRDQLGDGGRLVLPVGRGSQTLRVVTRRGEDYDTRDVVSVRFVPLTGNHA